MPRLLAVLSALAAVACNPAEMLRAKDSADKAVETFHAQYNDGKYGEIVAAVAEEFPAKDRGTFPDMLGTVHRKLGKAVSSQQRGERINSFNLRTFVDVSLMTTFEHGSGVESFRWVVADGKPRLVGYNLNSKDLLLK